MITYYWHEGVVYLENGRIVDRGRSWEEAVAKTQIASSTGHRLAGIGARIIKGLPPTMN